MAARHLKGRGLTNAYHALEELPERDSKFEESTKLRALKLAFEGRFQSNDKAISYVEYGLSQAVTKNETLHAEMQSLRGMLVRLARSRLGPMTRD